LASCASHGAACQARGAARAAALGGARRGVGGLAAARQGDERQARPSWSGQAGPARRPPVRNAPPSLVQISSSARGLTSAAHACRRAVARAQPRFTAQRRCALAQCLRAETRRSCVRLSAAAASGVFRHDGAAAAACLRGCCAVRRVCEKPLRGASDVPAQQNKLNKAQKETVKHFASVTESTCVCPARALAHAQSPSDVRLTLARALAPPRALAATRRRWRCSRARSGTWRRVWRGASRARAVPSRRAL
jgi:hypothetical protein